MHDMTDHITDYGKLLDQQYPREGRISLPSTASGPAPKTMIIACCDSHIDPARILRVKPGQLFVVRNVANLVPPYEPTSRYRSTNAMLEYAVEILQVEAIVVMGHSGCDGIRAFLTRMLGPETTCENSAEKCVHDGFIAKWTGLLRPAWGAVLRARASETEHGLEARLGKRSISYSIENLNTFPFIKHRIEAGLLNIYGVYFDSSVGALSILNAEMRSFEKFSGAMALHREHRTTGVH